MDEIIQYRDVVAIGADPEADIQRSEREGADRSRPQEERAHGTANQVSHCSFQDEGALWCVPGDDEVPACFASGWAYVHRGN